MNRPLSEDLRDLFERQIGAPPPGARQRVLAGVSHATRRPARRWQAVAGFVAVLLAAAIVATLLVARENQRTVPGHKLGVIPWLSLPAQLEAPVVPSPTPSPLPAGTPRCTPAQLQIDALGGNGAGGHVYQSFGFSGRGTSACFLQGTPSVALFDRSGRLLPFKARPLFAVPPSTGPVLVEPGPLPDPNTNMKSGQAGLTVDWVTQPEACPGEGVQIATAKIALDAGGPALTVTLTSRIVGGYTCGGLGIGSFEGPPPPVVEPPVLTLPAVLLEVPSSVRAGGVLVYQVTLTNGTLQPMDLIANCPNYGEELFPSDPSGNPPRAIKPLFQLNCTPAGTIRPSASLTFEMRLVVPQDEAPGKYKLFFTLGYWNAMTTPSSAPVMVTE